MKAPPGEPEARDAAEELRESERSGVRLPVLPGAARMQRELASPRVEVGLALLVLLSCGLFALQTLPSADAGPIRSSENAIGAVFLVEYMLRWYSQSFRPAYVFKPLAVIDLLSFLPLILDLLMADADAMSGGGLAFLRLLRVLRLQRFVRDFESFDSFTRAIGLSTGRVKPYQLQVARVVSSLFTLVFVSTGLTYEAEHKVNAAIPDYFTALYFGLTTLTTVGFGDITPITFEGRLVVCISILLGVAIIPVQLSSLAEALITRRGGEPAQPAEPAAPMQDAAKAPPLATLCARGACATCGASTHPAGAAFCFRCGAKLVDVPVVPPDS